MSTEPRAWRKKPVQIEALQYDGLNAIEIGDWAGREFAEKCSYPPMLVIPTLEGQHLATVGDFIIRGVKGEFYPCKPDIFAMTYEPATPAPESPAPAPVDPRACVHECEFSSDIDEPEMKCDKCGEKLEVVATSEIRRLRAQGSDIGTGSETSPDAGASIRERISDLLWDAHKDIGQWLQLAHATRRDRPTNEPTCPTMHGIKESDSVRVRLMAMISELMPNPEGAK